jgi:hypothetical protein
VCRRQSPPGTPYWVDACDEPTARNTPQPGLALVFMIVFNLYRKDAIRLVFWHGDRANDKTGFLEGKYADGRRLAMLSSVTELKSRKKAPVAALTSRIKHIGS